MSFERANSERGFTLIEVVISMVILLVVVLGALSMLALSITYNSGNKARAQATAVMQQEIERYRSAKFNSTSTDSYENSASPNLCRTTGMRDLRGREKSECIVIANDGSGRTFTVGSSVDNEPLVHGIQVESYVCQSPQGAAIPCTVKDITVEVRLAEPNPGWQVSSPAKAVVRRVRGN
ncbi:MAG: type II secretion system protein [Pyrinomonadaceae bacterium]